MTTDDEKERKKSRKKHKKKRRRRHRDESSSDEERRKKKKRKHKREYYSSSDEERRKKKKRKRRRDYDSSNSCSSSSSRSSDDSSREERRKEKKKRRKEAKTSAPPVPTFGQYGIIKASDFHKKQRSFEVWMAEVKGIASFNGPRWELQNYFKEYMEDFNTATLPHVKYYDYDEWEMKEYRKQQASQEAKLKSGSAVLADEARHVQEQKQRASDKKRAEMELLRSTMNAGKIQDMKRKQQLQSELAHAFKTGDVETQRRIQRKLEPEKYA